MNKYEIVKNKSDLEDLSEWIDLKTDKSNETATMIIEKITEMLKEKQTELPALVSNSLPVLITEQYPNVWIASLKGVRGMIATGETEE